MPGTPATTPRHAIPRIASTDTDDVPRDINAAVDRIDVTAPIFGSGLLSSRPSAGAGIADRYYYATDAVRIDGSTGVLYRDAGGAAPTWSAVTPVAPGPLLVTSLPVTPVDGQECYFVADATARILWHLRYNASGSTYKWEFLGGSRMEAEALGSETVAGDGAYHDTTTIVRLTAPLAGIYDVTGLALIQVVAAASAVLALSVNSAAPITGDVAQMYTAAAGVMNTHSLYTRKTLVKNDEARLRYLSLGGGNATVSSRRIALEPVRVG
jgi:hypothetical protein